MKEFYEENKYFILVGLIFAVVFFTCYFSYDIYTNHVKPKKLLMKPLVVADMEITAPTTHYVPPKSYFESFSTVSLPDDYTEFTTNGDAEINEYIEGAYVNPDAMFRDESASFSQEYLISNANQQLFDLADRYYQVYYGSQRISPIFPLALANVETGGRADHSITWSALFPSKIVPIEQLYTMDVTTVLTDASIYKALSTESSTRDRGALQMSTTYGTGNDYFNAMMSGTEVDKLSRVNTANYSAWSNSASSKPGDRFFIPDVCLRLSAANTDAVERMAKNDYEPETDMQLIAMLAMYHHRSGVWSNSNHDKSVGEWKSGELAYEYSKLVSSKPFIDALKKYATENEDKFWMDATVVKEIYNHLADEPMEHYAKATLVCTYPIKVEYAYIKLCLMYSK